MKENTPDLELEVLRAKEMIEGKLGTPTGSFAYPNGDHDDWSKAAVKSAGFEVAVSTNWGRNGRNQDLFALNRMGLCLDRDLSWRGGYSESLLFWRLSPLFRTKG